MGNWQTNHPDPDELIRYSNGELPARQAARVAHHLANCWECRTEIEDTTSVIGKYVHYRRSVLHPSIPPPPKEWHDLMGDFARIRSEEQHATRSFWPASWISLLRARPHLAATLAALVAVGGVSLIYLAQAPSVSAAELIERAVRQERTSAPKVKDIPAVSVKTRRGEFIRRRDLSDAGVVPAGTDTGLANGLEGWFASAAYSWTKPLSAVSFSQWRNQLPDKQDVVSTSRDKDAQDLVAVQTSTTSGALEEVTLFLRKADLHPIRGEFHFRNGEEVEIIETAAVTQDAVPTQPLQVTKAPRPNASAKVEPETSIHVSSVEELRVVAVLHRIGADLGDLLNVDREPSRIVVSGVGIKPERRAEIEGALRTLPHVAMKFSNPQRVPVIVPPAEPLTEKPGTLTFGRRIEQQLGSSTAMEVFSNTVLRQTEQLLVRSHALRQLGERFPSDVERGFGVDDKALLDQIRIDHETEVIRAADQIESALTPILVKLGVSVRGPESSNLVSWQSAAQNALAAGQRFDRVLATTLAPSAGMEDESAELGNALGALHAAVAPFRVERRPQ